MFNVYRLNMRLVKNTPTTKKLLFQRQVMIPFTLTVKN